MCGRFVMLTREEVAEVVAAVKRGEAPALFGDAVGNSGCGEIGGLDERLDSRRTERGQAFPGSIVATIGLDDGADTGTNSLEGLSARDLKWGFDVEWAKKPLFNTRIESALSGKGMWREMIRGGRCIVPALAFFEPHATETTRSARTGRQVKRPYRFDALGGEPLLLAGLRDDRSCSVVTTEPNGWVSPVHPRMPLVLRFDEVPLWLLGSIDEIAPLADRSSLELFVEPEFGAAQAGADAAGAAGAAGAVGASADSGRSAEIQNPSSNQLSLF